MALRLPEGGVRLYNVTLWVWRLRVALELERGQARA